MFNGNGSGDDAVNTAILKRTIEILNKTNPAMARAMLIEYRNVSSDNGLGELGFDWGSLISNAANAVVSVGTQYAGAKAQNKLAIQQAEHAAKLATKDIENSIKQQRLMDSYAASRDSALYKTSMVDSAKSSLSEVPAALWVALVGLGGALGFSVWDRKKSKSKKRK